MRLPISRGRRPLLVSVVFTLVAAGCGGGGGGSDDRTLVGAPLGTAEAVIGPAGGTVVAVTGVTKGSSVTIPPGALSTPTKITLEPGTDTVDPGETAVGPAVTLGPSGTTFAMPVIVSLRYDPALVPSPSTAGAIVVNHRDDATGAVARVVPSSLDTAGAFVTAETTSFSTFQPIVGPLRIAATLPAAIEGASYSQTLTATGGSMSGFTWSIASGALPAGLTLGTGGTPSVTLSGTPSASGAFSFTVRAQDDAGGIATVALTLIVNPPLALPAATLASAIEGGAYGAQISGAGGSLAGYAWSVASGALPPGVTLTATGTPSATLSGTPTQDGSFGFTVRLADSTGAAVTRAFTLVVTPGVEITTAALQNGVANVTYTAGQLTASAGSGAGYTWQVVAGALPGGLALAPTGTPSTLITGIPVAAGTFDFTIRVRDSVGGFDDQAFTLTVNAGIAITTLTLPDPVEAAPYSEPVTSNGGSGSGVVWSLAGGALPSGLSLFGLGGGATRQLFLIDFQSLTTGSPLTYPADEVDAALGAVQIERVNLLSGSSASGHLSTFGFPTSVTQDLTKYFSIQVAVPPGSTVTLGSFAFAIRNGGSGAFQGALRSSADGFAANIIAFPITGAFVTQTAPLGANHANLTGPVEFRVYGWDASSDTGGSTRIDDIVAMGTAGTPAGANITVTGTATTAGPYSYTLRVQDSTGASDQRTYSGAVQPRLAIPAATLALGVTRSAYAATVASAGGTLAGHAWSVSAGALPPGLSLASTGAASVSITGTPTAAGTFNFTLRVQDSSGASATRALSIVVNEALEIVDAPIPNARPGAAYSLPVAASGGSGAGYAWSIVSGALPAGLTLAPGGTPATTISGTTSSLGTFDFTVRVTDSFGGAATRAYTLLVTNQVDITTLTVPGAIEGGPYSATIAAVNGSGYSWSIGAGALPAGLTLSASGTPSTTISGTPAQDGTFDFTVHVSDSSGGSSSRAFTLVVDPGVEIVTATLPRALGSVTYTPVAISATAGSLAGYTWRVVAGALPAGMTISASGTPSTTLSGVPSGSGTFDFTLRVTDGVGGFDDQAFSLVVDPGIDIVTTSLPTPIEGVPYSQVITTVGGSGAGQTWTLASGALPAGVTGLAVPSATRDLALFTYTGVSGSTSPVDADVVDNEVQTPVQIFKVNLGSSGNTGEYGASSWTPGAAIDFTKYYSVVISPKPGRVLNLARFETRAENSGSTAPTELHVRSSRDGFASDLVVIPLVIGHVLHGVTLSASDFSSIGSPVEFRLYGTGATSLSTTLWTYLDDTRIIGDTGLPVTGTSITLSGTPTTPGPVSFTVRVTDSAGTVDTQAYSLDVGPRLGIGAVSLPVAVTQTAYAQAITATGGTGAGHSWSIISGALPPGLSLGGTSSPTLTISGVPAVAGIFGFTLEVRDGSGIAVTRSASIVVNDVLHVVTAAPTQGSIGVPYTATLAASGGSGAGYAWRLSGGALPAGLTLSASGVLSGTPSAAGSFGFSVEVTDSYAAVASRSLALSIDDALAIFTPPTLRAAIQNVAYSVTLTGIGGTGAGYTWEVVPLGTEPPGLTLTASGTLTGAPVVNGVFTFTVRLRDSASDTVDKTFSLSVTPELDIATPSLPATGVNASYSATISATGGSQAGFSWQLLSGALPPGLSLGAAGTPSTTISGTPTTAGTYSFTVEVTDDTGETDAAFYSLSVGPAVDITTTTLPPAPAFVSYSRQVAATSGSGTGYAWSVVSGALPAGLTLSATGTPAATLSGIPRAGGSFAFTVQVRDSVGSLDTQALVLQVQDLEIRRSPKVDGTLNVSYTATLTGAGGSGAGYGWAVVEGALPQGVTLDAAGTPGATIHGTPTTTGAFLFSVRLTDSAGASVTRRYTIDVRLPMRYAVGSGDEVVDAQTEVVLYDISVDPPTQHRILPIVGGVPAAWPSYTDASTTLEELRFSPDGKKLAFSADITVDNAQEVWVVDLTSGPQSGSDFTATRVSVKTQTGDGDTDEIVWSPDSRKLIYEGDLDVDTQQELYLADVTDPAAPGPQRRISLPMTTALELVTAPDFSWAFSPDSSFVGYRADANLDGRDELFVTYVGLGATFTPFQVNAQITSSSSADEISFFWWIPNQPGRLVYVGEQDAAGVYELFMADVSQGGVVSRAKLNGALATNGDVDTDDLSIEPSPDGTAVLYIADERIDAVPELFVVDVSGAVPGPSVKLNPDFSGTQSVTQARWAPDSAHVAYTADAGTSAFDELFVVDPREPGLPVKVNPPLTDDVDTNFAPVENPLAAGSATTGSAGTARFVFSPDGRRIAFVGGTAASGGNDVLFVSDLVNPGVEASEVISSPTGRDVSSYSWAPDGSGIAYASDIAADAVSELYHVDLAAFPAVGARTKISRPAIPSGGDVNSAIESVYFVSSTKVLYRADDRIDNAQEVTVSDFTDPSAIVFSSASTPAASSAHIVTSIRLQQAAPLNELRFASKPPLSAKEGLAFSYTARVSNARPPATISLAAGAPSWLSFDPQTGLLSGTPSAANLGPSAVTLVASNGVLPDVAQSFTLHVIPASTAPVLSEGFEGVTSAGTMTRTAVLASGTWKISFGETLLAPPATRGDWEIGMPTIVSGSTPPNPVPAGAFAGTGCAATVLNGSYSATQTFSRLDTPVIDLSSTFEPALRFHHFYEIEESFDGGRILVAFDGASPSPTFEAVPSGAAPYSWPDVSAFDFHPGWSGEGTIATWEQVDVDLAAVANGRPLDQVIIRFEFGADINTATRGWLIDEVHVGERLSMP